MKKRIFAILMAAALVLAMSLPAFAAAGPATGSLTVTGNELKGKTVSVYQIFTAVWDDTNTNSQLDSGENVEYTLTGAWEPFFTSGSPSRIDGITGVSDSEKAYKYVAAYTGDTKDGSGNVTANGTVLQLAKDMKAWAAANNIAATASDSNANGDTVTFANLSSGYYLVVPESGSTSVSRQSDATLVNVPSGESASWNIKSEYPTVEKTINGEDDVSSKIGDEITFTLESKIPEMTEYASTDYYTLRFHDTFSNGLTFSGTDQVTVMIVDKDNSAATTPLTANTDYLAAYDSTNKELTITMGPEITVSEPDPSDPNTQIDVQHRDLKTLLTDHNTLEAGDKIVITYKAKLNENAVVYDANTDPNYNKNTAYVEYSNDPGDASETGDSSSSETKTYTYPITINKHDDTTPAPVQLGGAVFELRNSSNTAIDLVSVTTGSSSSPSVYRVATADDTTTTTTVTTPTSGLVTINGLSADSYSLVETTAPTGYNLLSSSVAIVIAPTNNGTEQAPDYDYGTPVYTVNGATDDSEIEVVNTAGAILPTTGDIGTIGLTIAGVAIVIFGVLATSRRKKTKV